MLANVTPAKLIRQAEFHVDLDGTRVYLKAAVMEGLLYDLVLGMNSMEVLQMTIDVKKCTLTWVSSLWG